VSLALPPIRLVSVGAFGVWLLLASLAYQQVPDLEYAWSLNMLEYLPDWAGWLLVVLALLVTTEEARNGAIQVARAAGAAGARLPRPARELLLLLLAMLLLWVFREHGTFAHSDRSLMMLSSDAPGIFPGGGAVALLQWIVHGGVALGYSAAGTVQLANCFFGSLAVVLVARASASLGPAPAYRAIPLLVFSAGLFRAVGGRIDSQPLFIAAAAGCLVLAVQNLQGRGRLALTALAFGATAALDPLGRFLLPGLAALAWLSGTGSAERSTRAFAVGRTLAVALVPLAIHAALLLASADTDADRVRAAVTGRGAAGWVRLTGPVSRANTNYLLFSHAHLKYLANAIMLLAPAALPLLIGLGFARRGRIVGTPVTRFLAISCISLVAGSCLIRPVAGPFDWDIFGLTALYLAFFAGALLGEIADAGLRTHLAAAAIGLQLLFFGLPLAAIAFGTPNPAGPFVERAFPGGKPGARGRAPPTIGRWL
jgi:hypothetical protein